MPYWLSIRLVYNTNARNHRPGYTCFKRLLLMARILVIDDDTSLLQMMSLMLKRAGHEPILVRDLHRP